MRAGGNSFDRFCANRPYGGYQFIMADPPWNFELRSEAGDEKSAQAQYDCMSLEDINALPVGKLAGADSLLWLWCTHPMLPQALETLSAWGFTFKTSGVWSKRNPESGKLAFGTGYVLRCASEPFLIGTIGSPKTTRSTRTVIEGPRREHSRKPDEAYTAAESLMPDIRRADLFSRQTRSGWDNWGDEAEKFDEVAA